MQIRFFEFDSDNYFIGEVVNAVGKNVAVVKTTAISNNQVNYRPLIEREEELYGYVVVVYQMYEKTDGWLLYTNCKQGMTLAECTELAESYRTDLQKAMEIVVKHDSYASEYAFETDNTTEDYATFQSAIEKFMEVTNRINGSVRWTTYKDVVADVLDCYLSEKDVEVIND